MKNPRQQFPPSSESAIIDPLVMQKPVEFKEQLEGTTGELSGRVLDPPFSGGGANDRPSNEGRAPSFNSDSVEFGWTTEEVRRLQQEDANIGSVMAWLETGWRPPKEELDIGDPEIKSYWMQWDSLTLRYGLVYRKFERPDGVCQYLQLLMPRSMRCAFLKIVHEQLTGHLGYEKTLEQVQRRAFWESWKTDVKLYCACCKPCNEFYRGHLPRRAGLKPLFAGAPMEVLHVDLTGPHVSSHGYRYIMTACDSFTRFVIAVPLL